MAKTSEAKLRANRKHYDKTYTKITINFRKDEHEHILEHLGNQPNKRDYLIGLIERDMNTVEER